MITLPSDDIEHVLAGTAGLWEEMRGKRIFITGGTGFFGCWLLESFVAANRQCDLGATAVVLSRDPGAFAQKVPALARCEEISWVQGSVLEFSKVEVARQLGEREHAHYFAVIHL